MQIFECLSKIRLLLSALSLWALLSASAPALAKASQTKYDSPQTQQLLSKLLKAHGGAETWQKADSLWFQFMTNVKGSSTPFYSQEHLKLRQEQAYLNWPLWNARTIWDGKAIYSENWPIKQLPPGFFTKLTASFISLPWLAYESGASISQLPQAQLPDSDQSYPVIRLQYHQQRPEIPGTYLDIYIDPKTHLMAGIGFDINHPMMVANPKQAIGPNFHIMKNYQNIDGLLFPSYYTSYGKRPDGGFSSNAAHMVFDIRLDKPFDSKQLIPSQNAVEDKTTLNWWQGS